MAKIDPNDPRAPYQQIADDLRRDIRTGKLQPGQRVASSRELAGAYGVAAMTVHQAVRLLRDEGLVDSWQGRGVFVRSERTSDPADDLPARIDQIKQTVEHLTNEISSTVTPEIEGLRQQLGLVQAQLIELYARTGHAYPRSESEYTDKTEPRSRATGA